MGALDDMLPACDFVLVACPLTASTRGLFDAARLARMKAGAVLINVARAAIVEEEALYRALASRSLAGAIMDVWYSYPTLADPSATPARFEFGALDNVIMTPHASAWTNELIVRRWQFIAANLDRFARGEAVRNVVIENGKIVG